MKHVTFFILFILLISAISCRKAGEASKKEQHATFEKLKGKWIMTEYYGESNYTDINGVSGTSNTSYSANTLTTYGHESSYMSGTYDTTIVNPYTVQLEFTEYSRYHQRLKHIETINKQGNVTVVNRITHWKEAKEGQLFITLYGTSGYQLTFLSPTSFKLISSYQAASPGAQANGTTTMVFVKM